ncbi:hypothetical protein GCM10011497_06850 [Elstera cyanobacteriorum]|uniref:Uncharacterized protein n=1 Tax=Elstera cyanobacteriorum TaxID=2022747 RepID=A0A255XUV8_9PROT|nr:hypothetical protein [Elstera cyanobacteriorum]OYQ20205.1 hypothetical protein CHR90_05720 [Elstera cyanobacteriorum]GFZ80903.1 hypothetical protein GCM10011497_06850 [Elstera cyanobacteriorum]
MLIWPALGLLRWWQQLMTPPPRPAFLAVDAPAHLPGLGTVTVLALFDFTADVRRDGGKPMTVDIGSLQPLAAAAMADWLHYQRRFAPGPPRPSALIYTFPPPRQPILPGAAQSAGAENVGNR